MGLSAAPVFASSGIGEAFATTENFSPQKNERVVVLDEAFPEASVAPGVDNKKKQKASKTTDALPKSQQTGAKLTTPKPSDKVEEIKVETKSEKPVVVQPALSGPIQAEQQTSKPVAQMGQPSAQQMNDYQVMSSMQRELQRLKMIEQITKVQTNIQKQQTEAEKAKKDMVASDLMNMRLGPPGKGSMELPVIPAAQVVQPLPPKPAIDNNGEPSLRVVGIQGFDGVFSAQILNNGGLTSVDVGTEIDGGIKIISINETGVKVKKKITKDGKTTEEVISLPFSK